MDGYPCWWNRTWQDRMDDPILIWGGGGRRSPKGFGYVTQRSAGTVCWEVIRSRRTEDVGNWYGRDRADGYHWDQDREVHCTGVDSISIGVGLNGADSPNDYHNDVYDPWVEEGEVQIFDRGLYRKILFKHEWQREARYAGFFICLGIDNIGSMIL